MNRNASFVRKVTYIVLIALLLLPLAALSQPATSDTDFTDNRDDSSRGGMLARLRGEYNLAQAELGEIDPASETMKLSTLGLRGIAANVLWIWANHYKKVEDWDKLELTVQQIIRLQPNFLEVWDFQAHNLSYNVSVEFDDYEMRYQWVKKGIDFLILGTHYNRKEPGLLKQVGWFTGQKVGRADEQKQFRRLFKDDKDFHQVFRLNGVDVDQQEALGPDVKPDNWLVARLWFNEAVDAVISGGKPIRGTSPLLFYSSPPMSQINGAGAMQKDGYFFERAQIAWQKAADEWQAYGARELPSSSGYTIRLNEYEALLGRVEQLRAEMEALDPGLREDLRKKKMGKLSPEMLAAYEKPEGLRTPEELGLAYQANMEVALADRELIEAAPREARLKMRTLVDQIENDLKFAESIDRNRQIVNFVYWRTRANVEKETLAQGARSDVYTADQLFASGEKFADARSMYEKAWGAWAEIFQKNPMLMDNAEAQDLVDSIKRYRDLLGQLDEPFPADFKLTELLGRHEEGRQLREQVRLLNEGGGAAKPDEKQPAEKPVEPQVESPTAEPKPAEPKAAEPKPDETVPDEKKAGDAKSGDAETAEKQP